ncbi:MAG: MYXO-CTERM sorting domain-containing protein [Nannocystaceae bacterium]
MFGLTTLVLTSTLAGPLYDPGPVRPEDGVGPAQIEVSRIQRHLSHVEQTLRDAPPAGLSAAQLQARERALDVLHEYWQAGQFPKNRDYSDRRVPYFIDADGVACAVGQLMLETDGEQLAREIATYENNDFLAQIDHPGVPGWLQRNGFEPWEAAWIQPSYGPCGFGELPLVCGTDGNTYLCEPVAVECAGVEVAYEGPCGSETGTGGSSDTGTEPGEVIGEEICVGGTADASSTGVGDDATASGGDTQSGTTQGGDTDPGATGSGGGSSTGTPPVDGGSSDDADEGCSCRSGGSGGAAGLALLLLGLVGRRRRR